MNGLNNVNTKLLGKKVRLYFVTPEDVYSKFNAELTKRGVTQASFAIIRLITHYGLVYKALELPLDFPALWQVNPLLMCSHTMKRGRNLDDGLQW